MTSKAHKQYKIPSPVLESEILISEGPKAKRQATVYDAVAGELHNLYLLHSLI
jgi:hypothetical protein